MSQSKFANALTGVGLNEESPDLPRPFVADSSRKHWSTLPAKVRQGVKMSERNKAIIRRLYEEAHCKGNLDVIDEVYAHDVELHIPGIPEDPYGPAAVKQLIAMVRRTFPGITVTVEDLVAENDKVVANVTWRGPNIGRGQGASPYVPLVAWARLDVYRLFNGRIVEQWADRDDLAALHALGVT